MCLAVPGRVVEIYEEPNPTLRRGRVDFAGVKKDVCLAFTPGAEVGHYVLVHVGFALCVVDEEEANRVFAILNGQSGWE